MITNVLNLKGFEVYESTFQDRRFKFQNRNIVNDKFKLVVHNQFNKIKFIDGIIMGDEVVFYYSPLETLKPDTYKIEFWANFKGIGKHCIAVEEFMISLEPRQEINQDETVFKLEFKQEIINFQVKYSLTNMNMEGQNMTPLEVKQMYESNINTNAFTDNDKNKLSSISNFDPTSILSQLNNKVTNIPGKTLSTNDFTTPEKMKLASISNYDDAEIKSQIESKADAVEGKQMSDENFSTSEKEKLDGLENYDDSDIYNELDKKVDKIINKGLSDNNFSDAYKAKLESLNNYDDTNISNVLNTKVDKVFGKVLSDNNYPNIDKDKLASLQNFDPTSINTALSNKVDKSGTKILSDNNYSNADKTKLDGLINFDPSSINAALTNKVDKESGKGLSSNDFSSAEKTKLAGLQNYNDSSIMTSLSNKVDKIAGKGLSTVDFSTADKTKLDALISANFSIPTLRSGIAKATAYQALVPTKPAIITLTLNATSNATLSIATNNSANIIIGATNAVATGTGIVVGKYNNTLSVGVLISTGIANTYTIALPIGWYFAVVNTNNTTGVAIDTVVDQTVG